MKLKLIFPLLLFSFSALGDPMATERLQIKENRTLNEKVSNQKAELDQLKLSKMALEEQLKVASFQLEEMHSMHDDFLNRMNTWIAISAIAVSIFSIIGFLFGIRDRRAIKKDSDDFVNQQKEYLQKEVVGLENLILDKFAEKEDMVKKTLKRLVDSEAYTENLKIRSKLLIFDPYHTNDKNFNKVLTFFDTRPEESQLSFAKFDEHTKKTSDFISSDQIELIKKVDALIIQDPEGKFYDNHYKLLIDIAHMTGNQNVGFYYYGRGTIYKEDVRNVHHLLAYSNVPAQFYANLLNLLKYRDELLNEQGS